MEVVVVRCLGDNFGYIVIDSNTNEAALVDPVDSNKFLGLIQQRNLKVTTILTTHKHWDHAGGNDEIKAHIEGLSVVGGRNDDVKGCNRAVSDGDSVRISENLSALSLWTPCHTRGHTCYFIQNPENENDSHVFTGDTLFIAGCGKFFEGSASETEVALVQKLGKLPDETKVWCGHEYTLKNLEFAASVETENKNILEKLEWAKNQRECMKDTVPSSILEEKLTNPFMRVHIESVQNAVSSHDPIHTMELLRELKNNF